MFFVFFMTIKIVIFACSANIFISKFITSYVSTYFFNFGISQKKKQKNKLDRNAKMHIKNVCSVEEDFLKLQHDDKPMRVYLNGSTFTA